MENLTFALNATMPIFLLIVVGYVLKLLGVMSEEFAGKLNSFVFKVSLPVMLFADIAPLDIRSAWDTRFVLFCFFATLAAIFIAFVVSRFAVQGSLRGEFIQASYRSSQAILGGAFMTNIYGNAGMTHLMIIGSVPVYNISAVLILSLTSPENTGRKFDKALLKKTCAGVIKNPLIIGILAGLLWCGLKLPLPGILLNTASKIGSCASPLGLMAMGACFDMKKALNCGKGALIATFIKLIGLGLVFVPVAYALGFRGQDMAALLIMFSSSTTVTSYVMARNMGHEGTLSSAAVMLTTLFASLTLTLWFFVLRNLGVL